MGYIGIALLTVLQLASAATLQFVSPPPDRSITLYSAPPSYNQVPGKPTMNTIIIKSDSAKSNDSRSSNLTSVMTKWKRNLFVSRNDKEINNYDNVGTERNLPQYSIDCTEEKSCSETITVEPTPTPTFKPYSQEELEAFLKEYAAAHGKLPGSDDHQDDSSEDDVPKNKLANLYMDEEETINVLESTPTPTTDSEEKPKSAHWQLIKSQTHNHPYDDQQGWVTLDPIPWSSTQIQKWEPNPHRKPQIPPWDSSSDHHHSGQHSGHWSSRPPQNDWTTEKPWHKPSYVYKPSSYPSHNSDSWHQESKPQHWISRPPPPQHWSDHSDDIITDGRPGYFPSERPAGSHRPWYDNDYASSRPAQYGYHDDEDGHRPSYPGDGDGKWVLLSSTKGYSVPQPHRHRGYQRAMMFDAKSPDSVSSHRTVRLTVLPALDNSTNMTTSHGGLLEVESSFQTVDEAQREHAAKMMKLEGAAVNASKAAPLRKSNTRSAEVKIFTAAANPSNDKTKQAVLAAVGAGMIPATMAMLLPMVLGRKKRSTHPYPIKYFMYKAKKPVRTANKKKFTHKFHYR